MGSHWGRGIVAFYLSRVVCIPIIDNSIRKGKNKMKYKRNILIIIIDIFLGVALIYEFGSLGISLFVKMNFTIAFIAIIMMYKRLGIFSYLKYTIGQYLPMVLIPGI